MQPSPSPDLSFPMSLAPFRTPDYNAQLVRSLGKVFLGAASIGEVTAVAGCITDGDDATWSAAWGQLADRLGERAAAAEARGDRSTARGLWLRAAEAHRQASFFRRVDLDDPLLQRRWRAARDAFRRAAALSDFALWPVAIPFDGTRLSGYLALPARADGPLPALVVPGGYDSIAEEIMTMVGLPALARGYAVLAVDGPGQGGTLYDPQVRLFMRPDWRPVIAGLRDWLCARPEIDRKRIAAVGISFGGLLVPNGAADQPRLAALVADPAVTCERGGRHCG
jgi:hypothetical protein